MLHGYQEILAINKCANRKSDLYQMSYRPATDTHRHQLLLDYLLFALDGYPSSQVSLLREWRTEIPGIQDFNFSLFQDVLVFRRELVLHQNNLESAAIAGAALTIISASPLLEILSWTSLSEEARSLRTWTLRFWLNALNSYNPVKRTIMVYKLLWLKKRKNCKLPLSSTSPESWVQGSALAHGTKKLTQ